MVELAAQWNNRHPSHPIGIGDMSGPDGKGDWSRHPGSGHAGGNIIDVRPMTKNGGSGNQGKTQIGANSYDRALTSELVQLLFQTGKIKTILFNDGQIKGVHYAKGHHDHLHIVFSLEGGAMRFKSWLKPVGLFFTCTCLSSLCLILGDIFPGVVPQPASQTVGRPQAARQRMKLLPVDEGNRNGSFRQFRRELLHALHKRDKAFLRRHLSPHIMNGFGGSGGLQEFQETWHWEKPDSLLWEELAATLRLGGRFSNSNQTEFTAPYVATEWEQVQKSLPDGPERFAALVAAQVPVYQTPSRQAPVISSLSYEVVEVVEDPDSTGPLPSPGWQKIKLAPGQFGFVEGKFLRDPTGYRATFRKVGTMWKMTVFLAGD